MYITHRSDFDDRSRILLIARFDLAFRVGMSKMSTADAMVPKCSLDGECWTSMSENTVVFLAKIVSLHLSWFLLNIFTSAHNGFVTTSWFYSTLVYSIDISFNFFIHSDEFWPVSQEGTRLRHWSQMSMKSDWERFWSLNIYPFRLYQLFSIYDSCNAYK